MQQEIVRKLTTDYRSALKDFLAGEGDIALQQAHELGQKAITAGLGVLDLAAVHHEALAEILDPDLDPKQSTVLINAAGNFFAETLSPCEMAQRGAREGHTALRRLNEMLEEEAERIAHALHDEAGQLLASVDLALDMWARELPLLQQKRLHQVRQLLNQVEEQLRGISHELRPTILDDLGLLPALKRLAQGVAARRGIRVTVNGPKRVDLPKLVETNLYRMVQEALTNASKHAQANWVQIRLARQDETICCTVQDDGIGFDVSATLAADGKRGLGLSGIRKRLNSLGGTLRIDSAPGRGTELRMTIQLEAYKWEFKSSLLMTT